MDVQPKYSYCRCCRLLKARDKGVNLKLLGVSDEFVQELETRRQKQYIENAQKKMMEIKK